MNTQGWTNAITISFDERDWQLPENETPPVAAHLVTTRCGYSHHGIYVGNGRVVHYSGLSRGWKAGPVEEVSIAAFAQGESIWVRPHLNPHFDCNEVVARACSRLGENCYQLVSNNCEHFCHWCVQGESRSRQIDALRSRPKCLLRAVASSLRQWLDRWLSPGLNRDGWAI